MRDLPTRTVTAAAAVVFFIASFLPAVGASTSFGGFGIDVSIDAWHSWATPCLLIFLATSVVWALQTYGSGIAANVQRWVPAVAGGMTALLLLRLLTWTGSGVGLRWGAFVLIIAGIVFTVTTAREANGT